MSKKDWRDYERIEDIPIVQAYMKTAQAAVYLRPYCPGEPIAITESKMGGLTCAAGLDAWPVCPHCDTQLNFILQIFQRDFAEMYFPKGRNLFQIFRCPWLDCPRAYAGDDYDMFIMPVFAQVNPDDPGAISRSYSALENSEAPLVEARFDPLRKLDYPLIGEEAGQMEEDQLEEWTALREDDAFWDRFWDRFGDDPDWGESKIGGWPDWHTSANYPQNAEGLWKWPFFQLGSTEIRDADKEHVPDGEKRERGLMIGDSGAIYFFVDGEVGEASVETRWDCA